MLRAGSHEERGLEVRHYLGSSYLHHGPQNYVIFVVAVKLYPRYNPSCRIECKCGNRRVRVPHVQKLPCVHAAGSGVASGCTFLHDSVSLNPCDDMDTCTLAAL